MQRIIPIVLLLAFSLACASSPRAAVELGNQGHLRNSAGTVAVAATADDLAQAIQAQAAKDTVGLGQLMRSGRFVQAPSGTRIQVIDVAARMAVGMSRVRMLDGPYAEQAGWVLDNSLAP